MGSEVADNKSKYQAKISVPLDEWQLVTDYFNEHKEKLKLDGIGSPTMLLRRWMLDKYRENTAHESTK